MLGPSLWSRIDTAGQLVLLTLGIHAGKDGYCFPSPKTIAETLGKKVKRKNKERWDTAFVRKGMNELRKEGLVKDAVKPGWPKGYRLGEAALTRRSNMMSSFMAISPTKQYRPEKMRMVIPHQINMSQGFSPHP